MANMKIRHLVEKPGRTGPRFFWQPSKALRKAGFKPARLPDERAQAIAKAEALNAEIDRWRMGEGEPGSAHLAAHVQPGTMADLIRRYKESRKYQSKAAKTRAGYDWFLKIVEAWAGPDPVSDIDVQDVQELYETYRDKTPVKAVALVRVLRLLLAFAVREKLIAQNPASKPDLETSKAFTGRLWPREAVQMFVEAADEMGRPSLGTAILIAWWTGQRQGDVLRLTRAAYRGGVFHVTQSKTGSRVLVPHSPIVQARIEAELKRQADKKVESAFLIVSEETGQPYVEDNFRHVFSKLREKVAAKQAAFETPEGPIPTTELRFMWLRHTAITELAQAGGTVPQIAAVSGHAIESVETILNRYLVRTKALAEQACEKRLAWLGGQEQSMSPNAKKLDS